MQVFINGNEVRTGATVLSGASIETPECAWATISMGSMGTVNIGPKTQVTVNYSSGKVELVKKDGYVMLSTNQGIEGYVKDADGTLHTTDPTQPSIIRIISTSIKPQAEQTGTETNSTVEGTSSTTDTASTYDVQQLSEREYLLNSCTNPSTQMSFNLNLLRDMDDETQSSSMIIMTAIGELKIVELGYTTMDLGFGSFTKTGLMLSDAMNMITVTGPSIINNDGEENASPTQPGT
jgi:hypothetical protein